MKPLTRRGGRRATAYREGAPSGGSRHKRLTKGLSRLGCWRAWGTRTPDPRLRSPSAFTVFSASCRTRSTLEGTNRLEGSAPPTTPLSSASGARTGKPARLDYRPRSSASEGSSSTYCRRHARGELPSRIPAPAPCGLRDAPCAASPGTPWIPLADRGPRTHPSRGATHETRPASSPDETSLRPLTLGAHHPERRRHRLRVRGALCRRARRP